MSIQQIVSPTRYIGRGKPRRTRKDIEIYHCAECGGYLTGWTNSDMLPQCCGKEMEAVSFIPNEQLDSSLQLDYKIRGSLNNNWIVVTWGKVKPEWIMLDNMSCADMKKCVKLCKGISKTEASGGITLDRAKEVAATGVTAISLGCLTHSAGSIDLSLEWKAV